MKKLHRIAAALFTLLTLLVLLPVASLAAFSSGSTGADGDLTPTAKTVLQIPESGVFNYGTVNIPSGVTVTFKKNTQNTPVTILATGDVTINGAISVNGANANYMIWGAGGPGGFDGGIGGVSGQTGRRGGGPGGGSAGTGRSDVSNLSGGGGGGGFAANGVAGTTYSSTYPGGAGGPSYGNERILPSIGGSGGGGAGGTSVYNGGGGGGGGGCIVIASSGAITVNGSLTANGGNGANGDANTYPGGGGGGSGGGIRLIANTVSGNGTITANGGSGGGSGWTPGGAGGVGRIRVEASTLLRTAVTTPPMSLSYAYAVVPPNMPSLSITSIGGLNVPSIPTGSFGTPDVMLPFNTQNPISVTVAGANIPVGTTVTVKASPAVGNPATSTSTLTGSDASSTTASVSLNISTAYPSVITASVTYQLTAANGGPFYAKGEKVDRIRVATNLGGGSTVTYITESGREIPAVL